MFEEFDEASRTKIIRDSQRIPRDLRHEQPVVSTARTAQLAAKEYLGKFRALIGAKAEELENLSFPPESDPIDAGAEYRFLAEKPQFDTTAVSYYQTFFGLPVWEAGLAVYMKQAPFRIVGAQTTRHPGYQTLRESSCSAEDAQCRNLGGTAQRRRKQHHIRRQVAESADPTSYDLSLRWIRTRRRTGTRGRRRWKAVAVQ